MHSCSKLTLNTVCLLQLNDIAKVSLEVDATATSPSV